MTAPRLAITTTAGRRYEHPLTGEVVPSVTTVIGAGIPKPALVPWAARMAAEHAVSNWLRLSSVPVQARVNEIKGAHEVYTEERANVGDIVHDLVDCWSSGVPFPEWDKEVDKFATQFIAFMIAKRPVFTENEVTLWSRRYGYAGTADWIARMDGRLILGDVKTGKRVYPEVGLQLSALEHADFILREDGREEPLPGIEGLAALHIRPRSWKLIPVYESGECFSAFLAAKKVMEWGLETAPNVFQGDMT
jgi:hypothetical protein